MSEPGMALGLPDSGLCSQPHLLWPWPSLLGGGFWARAEAEKPVRVRIESDFPNTAEEETPESPWAHQAWILRQKPRFCHSLPLPLGALGLG